MFFQLLNDGGPVFMYSLFMILILIILLIAKGLLKKGDLDKTVNLIGSIGLFSIAWGFFGLMLGLIGAFDAIEAAKDISPSVMAGGLKVGLLAPSFGTLIFLIARSGIIILTWMQKD
jgi:hypothetical protein